MERVQHLQTIWHPIGQKTEVFHPILFANSALLTAMGNDLGFDEAFSAPLGYY